MSTPEEPIYTVARSETVFFERDTTQHRIDSPTICDPTCPICLIRYGDQPPDGEPETPISVHIPECKHIFGKACLTILTSTDAVYRNKCPLCRTTWFEVQDRNHDVPLNTWLNSLEYLHQVWPLREYFRDTDPGFYVQLGIFEANLERFRLSPRPAELSDSGDEMIALLAPRTSRRLVLDVHDNIREVLHGRRDRVRFFARNLVNRMIRRPELVLVPLEHRNTLALPELGPEDEDIGIRLMIIGLRALRLNWSVRLSITTFLAMEPVSLPTAEIAALGGRWAINYRWENLPRPHVHFVRHTLLNLQEIQGYFEHDDRSRCLRCIIVGIHYGQTFASDFFESR
jgi:hypothetical protein